MTKLAILVIFLTGCAASQERKAQTMAYFAVQCEREGYANGTPEWNGCIKARYAASQPQVILIQ